LKSNLVLDLLKNYYVLNTCFFIANTTGSWYQILWAVFFILKISSRKETSLDKQ